MEPDAPEDATPVAFSSRVQSEEPRLPALFAAVFGHERDAARWRWQYEASPGGAGTVTMASAGEEAVGCVGLMRQDLCHAGTRIAAGQGCDAMMAETHRGQGLFPRLAHANYADAAARGCRVVVAFPNALSFVPTVRALQHRRIAVLKHYYRRLGTRRLAGGIVDRVTRAFWTLPNMAGLRVLRARIRRRRQVEITDTVPPDIEPLLAAYRGQQVLSVWKDAEYLRWRYQDHPQHSYAFHVLREGGRPVALAIVRLARDVAEICDLIDPRRDPRTSAELLREVVAWCGRHSHCQLVEFFGRDISFFDAAFATAGFRSSVHSQFTMTALVLDKGELEPLVYTPTNWTICYGDTDVV